MVSVEKFKVTAESVSIPSFLQEKVKRTTVTKNNMLKIFRMECKVN